MIIHQVLCGYDNGHRILATSIDLPTESKRILLMLSDMSGSYIVPRFENYLTGYPLAEINTYAFSKTWYAKEMKRPGCVWTHILLLDFSDLAKVRNVQELNKFFSYPTDTLKSYSKTLFVDDASQDTPHNCNHQAEKISQIIYALYTFPDKPVFIPASDSQEFENIILEIWNQQWPKLKRNFCFCTGSLASRFLNGKPFDLQIIPFQNVRTVQLEVDGKWVTDENYSDIEKLPWLSLATQDLNSSSEIRNFFFRYGSETKKDRAAFTPLLDIWLLLQNIKEMETIVLHKILSLFSQYFPDAEEVYELKLAIFGHNSVYNASEISILSVLATTEYYTIFDENKLNIQEKVAFFWEKSKLQAKSLLIRLLDANLNSIGEKILLQLLASISSVEALEMAKQKQNLLYLFVEKKPQLALSSEIWRGSIDHQKELFSILSHHKGLAIENWKGIVWAMLDAQVDSFAYNLAQTFPKETTEVVFDWLEEPNPVIKKELSSEWKKAIAPKSEILLKKLTKNTKIETVFTISSLLNPNSLELKNLEMWLHWEENAIKVLKGQELKEFMVFLLALGFQNFDTGGYKLVRYSFQIVYDSTEDMSISYESWKILDKHMPSLGWWKEWDKCEKLRRACANKFIQYNSAYQYFLDTFNSSTLEKIWKYCNETFNGREFIKTIKKQIQAGKMNITEVHRQLLFSDD